MLIPLLHHMEGSLALLLLLSLTPARLPWLICLSSSPDMDPQLRTTHLSLFHI